MLDDDVTGSKDDLPSTMTMVQFIANIRRRMSTWQKLIEWPLKHSNPACKQVGRSCNGRQRWD